MPASDAQIAANGINAARSTGTKSAEGKERSRRNALKHGLAATVVVPGEEAAEVACRVALMRESLDGDDDGRALILAERAGYLSMRLKRCYRHEEAMIARRVPRRHPANRPQTTALSSRNDSAPSNLMHEACLGPPEPGSSRPARVVI